MQVSDLYVLDLYKIVLDLSRFVSCMLSFSTIYSLANFKFCHNYKGMREY